MKEDRPCFTDLLSLNSVVLHPFFMVLDQEVGASPLDRNPFLVGGVWCGPRSKCGCAGRGHYCMEIILSSARGSAVEIWPQVAQAFNIQISKLVQILSKGSHLSYTDSIAADPENQFIPGLCSVLLQMPQSSRKGNRAIHVSLSYVCPHPNIY